jgi:hypothetical protein
MYILGFGGAHTAFENCTESCAGSSSLRLCECIGNGVGGRAFQGTVFTPSSQNLINIGTESLWKTLTFDNKLHGVASGNLATNIPTAVLTPDVGLRVQGFYWKSKKAYSSAAGEDIPLFLLPSPDSLLIRLTIACLQANSLFQMNQLTRSSN